MNRLIRAFVVSLFAMFHCAALAAMPAKVRPMDDPRVAQFVNRMDGHAVRRPGTGMSHAKSLLPVGTILHPADLDNSPTAAGSWFGFSLAASADYVVVGAPAFDPGGAPNTGRAYLFRRLGPQLNLVATLAAADGAAEDWFGYAVALDGDTVIVTANRDHIEGNAAVGSAYVFQRDGENWPQVAKLYPPGTMAHSNFGFSVLIEGDHVLVGAISSNPPTYSGALHRYQRIDGIWTAQGLVEPPDQQNAEWFGYSMARHGDELVVGSPLYDGPQQDTGRALVFQRNGDAWLPHAMLQDPASTQQEWFAAGLAISDGVIAASAFSRDTFGIADAGAVALFRKQGGFWPALPETTLHAPAPAPSSHFGWAIGLDRRRLWVSMPGAFPAALLFSYRNEGAAWLPVGQFSPPVEPNLSGLFGSEIEVTSNALFVSAERAQGQITNLPEVGKIHAFLRTAWITPQSGPGGQLLPAEPTQLTVGDPFALLVQPSPGFRIVAVTGCDGTLVGSSYLITVDDDCTVTATFANDAPQATGMVAESGVYEGESFAVTLTAEDLETPMLSYDFDCDGNGGFELGPQSGNVGACVVASAGNYTVVARARDEGGLSASLTASVSVLDSRPTVSISAAETIDEDHSFVVTTGAAVPSSGEWIVAVSVDCDYDGVDFNVDTSAPAAGNLQCPGYPLSGSRTLAARSTDNEGEHSEIETTSIAVNAVNDPPTFSIVGELDNGPAYIGAVTLPGFVHSVSVGPQDEQGQQVLRIDVETLANPNNMVSSIGISLDGTLNFTLSGRAGVARFNVTVTDNGGTPGQPTSSPQSFSISNGLGTDLQVSLVDHVSSVVAGASVHYELLAGNDGPNPVDAQLQLLQPAGLDALSWTCTPLANAACPDPASGSGDLIQTLTLPIGGLLRFDLQATVSAAPGGFISTTATLTPSSGAEIDPSDNSASDTNAVVGIGIFADGFETTGSR